jgi:hypothetical protein
MTDRELLELAAKAVGYDTLKFDSRINGMTDYEGWGWHPLADDCDALRLAVKLRLKIVHLSDAVFVEYNGTTHIEVNEIVNEYSRDRYAATRGAIVRAAAEIGKEMK